MEKGITVVICCYNSAARLPETIKHIALQFFDNDISWEVIIVNNNSTDNTEIVALTEVSKYGVLKNKTQIVFENEPGLSHAREKGISTAKFEYIIFCDDDNWLNNKYVQTAYEILDENTQIAAIGGQSEAVSDIPFPDWWEDYKGGYAVGLQAKTSGDVSSRKYLWGSGLTFRKSLYIKAFENHPSLLTDRRGNELSSGGDSEICMRFLLMGYNLYYDERLKFKHYITPSRLTWEYRKKLFQGFENALTILGIYIQYINILNAPKFNKLGNLCKNISKVILAILFNKKSFYTSYEANIIFFTTGVSLPKTSLEAKSIKNLI